MFKKFLASAAMALAFLGSAHAQAATSADNIQSIDVSSLTPEQKAALIAQTAQLKQEAKSPTNISEKVRSEASAWGELGANMGKAAVSAARELGLAANEFVQTPFGKITVALVVYKVAGADLLGLLFGTIVLAFFLSMSLYFVLKKKYDHVEYEEGKGLFGQPRRVIKSYRIDGELVAWHWVAAVISAIIGLAVGLNLIF